MSVKIWKVIFKRGGVPPKPKISEEKVRRHLDSNPGFSRQKFHLPGFLSSTLTRLKKEAQPLGFELGPLASDVFNLTKKPFVAFKGEEKRKNRQNRALQHMPPSVLVKIINDDDPVLKAPGGVRPRPHRPPLKGNARTIMATSAAEFWNEISTSGFSSRQLFPPPEDSSSARQMETSQRLLDNSKLKSVSD